MATAMQDRSLALRREAGGGGMRAPRAICPAVAGRANGRSVPIPVGRIGTPDEFGATAAFLASPLAAYVTGSLIRLDGGAVKAI